MKVTVDKCPWTGKLFEDPAAYRKHLRSVRTEQKFKREKARLAAKFDEFVAPLYQLGTTDEIAAWLTEHYVKIALHFGPHFPTRKPYIPTEEDRVVFVIDPLLFDHKCSTTHAAPLGQKHTGWSKDNPHVAEAGWRGKIHLFPKGKLKANRLVETDHLRCIGINTGSGGGRDDHLRYELTLFIKDFPRLRIKAAVNEIYKSHGKRGLDSNGKILEEKVSQPRFWE
jgi:hypothetical protein